MSRFVHIADLHAHVWSMFSQGDGLQNTRLQRSLAILEKSLAYAQQENIPWTFGGDLVHTAGYALNVVLAGLTRIFVKYQDVEKIVVWGNHDARGIGGVIEFDQTVWAAFANVERLWVLNGNSYKAGGTTFSGAGYQPRAKLLVYPDPSDVGLYHQTIRGSQTALGFELEGVDPAEMLERHTLSIVGHIHHSQSLNNGKVFIPGSPEHQNFGDAGPHGWWVFQEDYGRTFMDGESPEFRVVDTVDDVKEDKHFYRVRTVATGDVVPEGVSVIAPTPTVIKQRDTLAGLEAGSEAILQTWLATNPPERGITVGQAFAVGRDLLTAHTPTQLTNHRLTELTLTNFCCFAQATVTVKPGVCLITGAGRDYPSNGAGKSTLVGEALYWLLFGRTTKGLGADDVIRRGTNSCTVSGMFVPPEGHGMGTLRVIRERGPTGHTLRVEQGDDDALGHHVWETASVNAMTIKLSTYLGITPEIFQNLAYFSQEKLVLFSAATDGDRKDVLADLLGLSAYQDAATTAGTTLRQLKDERIALEARRDTLQETVERDQLAVAELRKARDEWANAHDGRQLEAEECYAIQQQVVQDTNVRTDRQRARVLELAKWLEQRVVNLQPQRRKVLQTEAAEVAHAATQERTRRLTSAVKECEEKILKDYPTLAAARASLTTIAVLEKELTDSWTTVTTTADVLVQCRERMAALEVIVATASDAVVQADAAWHQADVLAVGAACPLCGHALTIKARAKYVVERLKELNTARVHLKTVTDSSSEIGKVRDTAQRAADTAHVAYTQEQKRKNKLQNLMSLVATYDAKETELHSGLEVVVQDAYITDRLAEELTQYRLLLNARLRRAEAAGVARVRHQADVLLQTEGARDRVRAEENLYEKTHDDAALKLLEAEAQILVWENDLTERNVEAAIYTYWQHGFSKQGLQSLLVEEIAARFNQHRTRIFPVLTAGVYDVQFATRSRTREGEWRERTEFVIHEHGKVVPYAGLSGGQRRRVDIGVLLTLISAVSEWMGTPGVFGVLVLDEVFEFLDGSGSEGLLGALDQIATRIPTIYVIDHGTHLQSVVPNILHVVQDATGTSAIAE